MRHKVTAFIKRDFLIDTSYKLHFLLNLFNIFFRVSFFYFLAEFVGSQEGYFPFILAGIAVSDLFYSLTYSFSGAVREAQQEGTLEALAFTSTPLPQNILFSGLYSFLYTLIQISLYFVIAVFLFNSNFSNMNLPGLLLALLFSTLSFAGFGLLSSIFVLIFKRGDPVVWALNSLSWLLSGTLYPISVLPEQLQHAASLLPLTHALHVIRLTLIQGRSLREALSSLIALVVFFLLTFTLAIFLFPYALKKVKNEGGLSQY